MSDDEESGLPYSLSWLMRHWWAYHINQTFSADVQAKQRYCYMRDLGRRHGCSPHISDDWGANTYRKLLFFKAACATPRIETFNWGD